MISEIVLKEGRVYHLGLSPSEIGRRIIFVGDPARAHLVADHFDEIELIRQQREYVTITGTLTGQRLSVVGTGMSTDNVEIALMEIYTLLGFDFTTRTKLAEIPDITVLRIGTSGGVQADIENGTLAISQYALGFDSTGLYFEAPTSGFLQRLEEKSQQLLNKHTPTYHRFSKKLPVYASVAAPKLVSDLQAACQSRDLSHVIGITAITPGFYGPSARKIEGVVNTVENIKPILATLEVDGHKVVNMDMESSLLFHLGGILGFSCATICPIISGPNSAARPINYGEVVEQAIEVGLDVLLKE